MTEPLPLTTKYRSWSQVKHKGARNRKRLQRRKKERQERIAAKKAARKAGLLGRLRL